MLLCCRIQQYLQKYLAEHSKPVPLIKNVKKGKNNNKKGRKIHFLNAEILDDTILSQLKILADLVNSSRKLLHTNIFTL